MSVEDVRASPLVAELIPQERQIRKLKRSCAGKKGSITKRIEQLSRLMNEGGSRTKITFLKSALVEVLEAIKSSFEELLAISEDTDTAWIEEVTFNADTCIAEVEDYIDARKDDSASSTSLTESWVKKHKPRITHDYVDETSSYLTDDVAEIGARQYINPSHLFTNGKTENTRLVTTSLDTSHQYPTAEMETNIEDICAGITSMSVSDAYMAPQTNVWSTQGVSFGYDLRTTYDFPSMRHQYDNMDTSISTLQPPLSALNGQNQPTVPVSSSYTEYGNFRVSVPPASSMSSGNPSRRSIGLHDPPILMSHASVTQSSSLPPANQGVYTSNPSLVQSTWNTQVHPSAYVSNAAVGPVYSTDQPRAQPSKNYVDSWIDELNDNRWVRNNLASTGISPNVTMAWLVQQSLPRVKIPVFDGSPVQWVEFIT